MQSDCLFSDPQWDRENSDHFSSSISSMADFSSRDTCIIHPSYPDLLFFDSILHVNFGGNDLQIFRIGHDSWRPWWMVRDDLSCISTNNCFWDVWNLFTCSQQCSWNHFRNESLSGASFWLRRIFPLSLPRSIFLFYFSTTSICIFNLSLPNLFFFGGVNIRWFVVYFIVLSNDVL